MALSPEPDDIVVLLIWRANAINGVMKAYYEHSQVRSRMLEYLGGDSARKLTAQFITAGDIAASHHREPHPLSELPVFWQQGSDIGRSLWDRQSLLVHLDIEYVNFDYPAEPYLEPERIFELQRPIEWAVEGLLLDHQIRPLHLLSGRGHHFVWRVRQNSRVFQQLIQLGRQPKELPEFNAQPHAPHNQAVSADLGAAFAGLGLVMEFFAHQLKVDATPMCKIPIALTAVEVPPSNFGRELISLDISEYGDPLSSRTIRVPFSYYLKPWQQRGLLGESTVENLLPTFLIPLQGLDSSHGSRVMHDQDSVLALAEHATAKIPDQSKAMENLVQTYKRSPLAQFHHWYFSQEHHPPETWPENYDRTPLEALPACARYILEHPNDLLLKPSGIERIVRVMLALGWHPRHIAGLIRSRFERDYQWGDQWQGYVPAMRADFYTRIFSGLIVTGLDDLQDFTCATAQMEKMCFHPDCPDNLASFRNSLLERKRYERLACRPFNRLFLSAEHS